MRDTLRLTFEADTDGTGELFAQVRSFGFSGASSAWFDAAHLVKFAQTLAAAFPLRAEAPLELQGGFWSKSSAVIEHLHVGLRFYPVGGAGRVGCRISLVTPIHDHERAESQATVGVELRTTYEPLRAFARSIEMLVRGTTDEAILEAAA